MSGAAARAWQALGGVVDPEIPVLTVLDLGIVREVGVVGDAVEVVITPTYSGCPATHVIEEDIRRALAAAGFAEARIRTSLSPAWTTDWMTAEGRDKLRKFGIAPPGAGAPSPAKIALFRAAAAGVDCPHCGSTRTERLAAFGSTACKALYRCRDCREPFDHFKPI
ncbi:MAG TPA: 1,2-phenylacetyl-CoA epoxidase subunit PaaD [Burkholderiales bacterium]|nr:1,2-phenylacetyl-CoA epoxidase subunit PaaD [Burkholderiales bacterium]